MFQRLFPALLLSSSLAGCGGTLVVDPGPGIPPVTGETALAPTVTRADVTAFDRRVADLTFAPATATRNLPTGTVTYDGQLGSNIRLNGQEGYGILGDMRMRVGFGSGLVDGTVRNINLLQSGTPVQRFGGQLLIDGTEFSGRVSADADGILSLVMADGTRHRTNMAIDLTGDVVNDVFLGDTVVGTATGFGDGYQLSGETLNILLDGGGSFVGEAD